MNVSFNTWSGAFFNPGGGEVQLNQTRLELQKLGVNVELYNQWNPNRDIEVFHQFSIQPGVEYPMIEYRNLGKKIALSTILWVEYPKGTEAYNYLHRILNLADVLFTNSNAESQKLSRAFDVDISKFHKTVNGISEDFRSTITSKNFRDLFGIKGDFVLSVANIDSRKNTRKLLEACRILGLQLVTIGQIREPSFYNEFAGKYEGYRHLGPISDSEILKSAFQQATLFALPSLCETPGIAALEAASQGAKIVITEVGSTQEYFGDLVTYVNPEDLKSITTGIESELMTPRNGQMLSDHIVSNYSWKRTAAEVVEGYRKILRL